jgi:hypothetical protein
MGSVIKKERIPVEVEAYAGYKAGETPRKIFLMGRSYDVNLIVFRKRVVDLKSYEEEDHFRIELKNYGTVHVVYKSQAGIWELDTSVKPETTFAQMFE